MRENATSRKLDSERMEGMADGVESEAKAATAIPDSARGDPQRWIENGGQICILVFLSCVCVCVYVYSPAAVAAAYTFSNLC